MLFLHLRTLQGLDWLQKYIRYRPTVSNLNPVEVDSDEDNNSVGEQGETNDQTDQLKLGQKLLNLKTVADLWKLAKKQELMKRGPSQQRSLKRKGEKFR